MMVAATGLNGIDIIKIKVRSDRQDTFPASLSNFISNVCREACYNSCELARSNPK